MKWWMVILLMVGAYVLVSFLGRNSRSGLLRLSWLIIVLPFSLIRDFIVTMADRDGEYDEWWYERYVRKSTTDDFAEFWGKKHGKNYENNETAGQESKTPNAFRGLSKEAARKKYHALMKEYHPDNGGSSAKAEQLIKEYKEFQNKANFVM